MDKSQITQAMIDAYDEYTHLTLDRRRFMERLTALADRARPPRPSRPCWPPVPQAPR